MTQQNAILGGPSAGVLDRARIVAKPGFNRWLGHLDHARQGAGVVPVEAGSSSLSGADAPKMRTNRCKPDPAVKPGWGA